MNVGGCAVGSSTPTAASCPTKNFLAISRSSAMALDFATDRPQVVIAAVLKAMCEARADR
jgi:hypothetical protein